MQKIYFILILIVMVAACSSNPGTKIQVDTDPFYESFFEKTRLIMSKEEIQIYKHLPDKESRAEFIDDFWKKRDPTPDTEENEIREEYQERIDYANRWFNEHRAKDRGWDTERGRILLQLGFPEERRWGEVPDTIAGRIRTTQPYPIEIWIYYKYQLTLVFSGDRHGFDTFKLSRVPPQLGTVLEMAKRTLDLGSKKPKQGGFKYDADFKNGKAVIRIRTRRISFEEKNGTMSAAFRIEMHVYDNYKRIESIIEKKSIQKDKNELLNLKELEFSIPYSPPGKGEYLFDIIVTELSSSEKYRTFIKHKF